MSGCCMGRLGPATPSAPGGPGASVDSELSTIASTKSGKELVDRLNASGVQVKVVDDAVLQQKFGTTRTLGEYDERDKTIYVSASKVGTKQGILTLAHEAFHAIDDVSGLNAATRNRRAQTPDSAWQDKLIRESRAYTFEGEVARELHWDTSGLGPAVTESINAGSTKQAYVDMFERLDHDPMYNKSGKVFQPVLAPGMTWQDPASIAPAAPAPR